MKNLSELLAEVEPSEFFNSEIWAKARHDLCVDGWPAAVVLINQESRKLYEQNQKLKAIAVELAKAMEPALEYMKSSKPPICGCDLSVNFYCPECCVEISFEDAITTARKMLGDE